MVPHTFEEWIRCIEQDCGVRLTSDFAQKRIDVYRNPKHPETKKFISLYGEHHLGNVIEWFSRVR